MTIDIDTNRKFILPLPPKHLDTKLPCNQTKKRKLEHYPLAVITPAACGLLLLSNKPSSSTPKVSSEVSKITQPPITAIEQPKDLFHHYLSKLIISNGLGYLERNEIHQFSTLNRSWSQCHLLDSYYYLTYLVHHAEYLSRIPSLLFQIDLFKKISFQHRHERIVKLLTDNLVFCFQFKRIFNNIDIIRFHPTFDKHPMVQDLLINNGSLFLLRFNCWLIDGHKIASLSPIINEKGKSNE